MYIEKIKSPADLKKLDLKELQVVADETRQAVLNRVSKHGGHVGPNLGFVEATVALHYVFNAPKDKLVFDVSHQCYPHKVLTGRAAGFLGDVDDMNAISGYSSPAECPEYDNFEVGHTSTSVSLATGLQKARDIKGTDENIIAIIGDGSLSGGEAFEGLDEASELGTGIIIVVNDNEMSYFAVKAPVFSFEKLTDVDTGLGPEMKSTGEVLGLAETYPQALLKAFKGAGLKVPKRGSRIIVTVKDEDKAEMVGIARGFEEMGVEIYATSGTCDTLTEAGIQCKRVNRVSQAHPNILDMIQSGTVDLIINTPTKGRKQDSDGFKIRRSAVEHSVACVTAIDTARAVLTVREQSRSEDLTPIDITRI